MFAERELMPPRVLQFQLNAREFCNRRGEWSRADDDTRRANFAARCNDADDSVFVAAEADYGCIHEKLCVACPRVAVRQFVRREPAIALTKCRGGNRFARREVWKPRARLIARQQFHIFQAVRTLQFDARFAFLVTIVCRRHEQIALLMQADVRAGRFGKLLKDRDRFFHHRDIFRFGELCAERGETRARRQFAERGALFDDNRPNARARRVERSRRANHAAADDEEIGGGGKVGCIGDEDFAHRTSVSSVRYSVSASTGH